MRRTLWFLLRLGLVIALAVWVAQRPGTLRLDWQGYIIQTQVGVVAVALLLLAVVAYVLVRLFVLVWRSPGRLGAGRRTSRRTRGYQALGRGFLAVASGDGAGAGRLAAKADGLLSEPSLTLLLSAQAAQLAGDEAAAAGHFTAMRERGAALKQPDMAFVGVRGLALQALAAGQTQRALGLVQEAAALKPKARWPLLTQFDLQARAGDWTAAAATLDALTAAKALPVETLRRHRTALLVERSRAAEADGNQDQALALARKAHDLEPASVPAAVQAARLLAATGSARAATRALEQSWRLAPHPELAAAWGVAGEKAGAAADPLARVKRLEALVALDANVPEAHVALADAATEARLWGLARGHLTRALALRPTARVYRRLAALATAEHGQGAEERGHLAQAARAVPDAAWVCQACGGVNPTWGALCSHCGGFDTLAWRVPGASRVPGGGAQGAAAETLGFLPPPEPPAGGAEEGSLRRLSDRLPTFTLASLRPGRRT
ncbi:heme biosynthesis protein HemY [Nitrospirillum amazonense]|uniref:heme biosynthesis protein HemY n=1 Tax=Nitrospirillum amazonense TaxID=28077 RepID=UPI002412A9C2|nr:heme biosynthesis HemY N-terminal domain-containing protein [Nitrospirillum amazonense]MDG3440713.1 heme biosynthesis HemY N-terminal domain-containing protein [Nitrospirillum amazonense]